MRLCIFVIASCLTIALQGLRASENPSDEKKNPEKALQQLRSMSEQLTTIAPVIQDVVVTNQKLTESYKKLSNQNERLVQQDAIRKLEYDRIEMIVASFCCAQIGTAFWINIDNVNDRYTTLLVGPATLCGIGAVVCAGLAIKYHRAARALQNKFAATQSTDDSKQRANSQQ